MITQIIKVRDPLSPELLEPAADVIKAGGLVAFPTETVYGLGADATNPDAVAKIYIAKGRPSDNPLIIHIATPKEAELYTYTCELYYKLAEKFMPGPLTIVLPARPTVPDITRASLPTVAVRCPENKIARALISMSGVPIAAPSANISGSPSPTHAEHVIHDLVGRVDVIIAAEDSEFGLESTIVKIEDDGGLTLLRPGKITEDDLLPFAKYIKIAPAVTKELSEGEAALSPGMKYRHYAPNSPLFLLDGSAEALKDYLLERANSAKIALIYYENDVELFSNISNLTLYSFGKREDELTQAHLLFDLLRQIDEGGFDEIYAPLPQAHGVGLALYNRMIRAAAHQIIRM